jgi:hypothetical protein
MKALVTAVALGAVIASPAFAKTTISRQHQASYNAYNSYDEQLPVARAFGSNDQYLVNGRIVGPDPDPAIRVQESLEHPDD